MVGILQTFVTTKEWENVRRPLEIDIEAPVPGGWN